MKAESYDNKSGRLLRASTYLLLLFFAFSITMIGPLLPVIIRDFNLQMAGGGLVSTFQNMGGLLVTVLLIFIADRFKKSVLIITGFLIYIISLFMLEIASVYPVFLLIFFVLGVGTKAVDTLTNAFLSEMYPESRTRNLNLLHMFFGIGALLGPLYSSYLVEHGMDWRIVFRLLGIVSGVALVLFIFALKKEDREEKKKDDRINTKKLIFLIKDKGVWVLFVSMFLYTGHQGIMNIWLPMYMEDVLEAAPILASLALSIFWASVIAGRFVIARYGHTLNKMNIIRWGSICGAVFLTSGIIFSNPIFMILNIVLMGFVTGGFLPLILDIASEKYKHSTGMITSIIFLALNLSMMFFPWFTGYLAQLFSFKVGMMVIPLTFLGTFNLSFKMKINFT